MILLLKWKIIEIIEIICFLYNFNVTMKKHCKLALSLFTAKKENIGICIKRLLIILVHSIHFVLVIYY